MQDIFEDGYSDKKLRKLAQTGKHSAGTGVPRLSWIPRRAPPPHPLPRPRAPRAPREPALRPPFSRPRLAHERRQAPLVVLCLPDAAPQASCDRHQTSCDRQGDAAAAAVLAAHPPPAGPAFHAPICAARRSPDPQRRRPRRAPAPASAPRMPAMRPPGPPRARMPAGLNVHEYRYAIGARFI